VTKFFYDCEFIEDGSTIDLVSIGIVREDGAEYYAVSSEFDVGKLHRNPWLTQNVWPHLPLRPHQPGMRCRCIHGHLNTGDPAVKPRQAIAGDVLIFLLSGASKPALWAWYGAYDHVVLSQLWGSMADHPSGIPMWTNDLQQERERLGNPELPQQASGEHNALAAARHNLVIARSLGLVP
jgi:hypothetical protein